MSVTGNSILLKNSTQSESFLKLKSLLSQPIEENIDCILRDTLTFIVSDGNLLERTESFGIVFSSVLPSVKSDDLFPHLDSFVSAGYSLFEFLLNTIQDTLNDTTNLVSLLANIIQLLEGFIHCMNFIISSEHLFFELVSKFLKILEKSYQHCSECDLIYGESLVFVKDILQNLIVHCHNFQAKVLTYLDFLQEKCQLTGNINSAVIVSILENLFCIICPLAKAIEIKSTVTVWRMYFKLITKFENILLGKLEVSCVVTYLCTEVAYILDREILIQDSTTVEKNIKLGTFLFKLIVSLCDKFSGHLENCVKDILSTCTTLMKFIPHNFHIKERPDVLENIKRAILIGIDPLVESLLSDKSFVSAVLILIPGDSNSLQLTCLYITILDVLINSKDNVSEWFPESSPSLISRIFQACEFCFAQSMLPVYFEGVMHKGKPQQLVSYFHYVCVHVCAFISCISPDVFETIEVCLFSSVLSADPFVALLASEIICFIARFSTSELCYSHFKYVADILLLFPICTNESVQLLHLCSLMRRLFSFLNRGDQSKVLSQYPKVQILCHLKLYSFEVPLPLVNSWNGFESLQDLNYKFAYLKTKVQLQKRLTKDEEVFVFRLVEVTANETVPYAITEHVLSCVYKIVPALVNFEKKNELMNNVQQCARKGSEIAHILLVSCYQYWTKNLPHLNSPFVSSLARCAAVSLNETSFWLQELAFEHFAKISHPVVNEDLIRQTLKMCSPNVTSLFRNYMKTLISRESITCEERLYDAVRQVTDINKHTVKITSGDVLDIVDTTERHEKDECEIEEISPPLKKSKMDDTLLEHLQFISKAINSLEEKCQNCTFDESSKQEVQRLITRLNMLL